MDRRLQGVVSREVDSPRGSTVSIMDKSLNLITPNTELLIFIVIGLIEISAETAGYSFFFRLNDLMPPLPNLGDTIENNPDEVKDANQADLKNITLIDMISEGVDIVEIYTAHFSLATYLLLPYPIITERKRLLLVPWLLVAFLRLVVRHMVITIVGIVLCASHSVFYYPCVQYSAFQGAWICFILFFWTNVHSFYYYLDRKSTTRSFYTVINSIKNVSTEEDICSHRMSRVLSVDVDDDDEIVEATLVEKAAMAWIAREILENDEVYLTDRQFNQYLAIKATMELRNALKELQEKKHLKKRTIRKASAKEKIEDSLEFMKLCTNPSKTSSGGESLSSRDQLRKLSPLATTSTPAPAADEESLVSGLSSLTDGSVVTVDAESQTEPPTHKMSKMLDILEYQQQQRQKKSLEDQRNSSV